MGKLDATLKRYYRGIWKALPCSRSMRNQILQQIQENVSQFLEQNPSADFDAVQNRFGSAQEIAYSYIDDQNTSELLCKIRLKKKVLAIFAGVMAAFLLIWGAAVICASIDASNRNDGYIVVDVGEN